MKSFLKIATTVALFLGGVAVVYAVALSPSQIGNGTVGKGYLPVARSVTSTQWFAPGSNGLCLTASSTATNGVDWNTCGVSSVIINGVSSADFTFATSTATSTWTIATSTDTLTFTIPSNVGFFSNDSGYLLGSNDLSDLNSSSTARTNLGLSLPLAIASGGTGTSTTPTNGQLLIGGAGGYSLSTLSEGSGITITNATGSISIASTGGTPAGGEGDVQFNSGGSFDADTEFSYNSSTKQLFVNNSSSSLQVGSSTNFGLHNVALTVTATGTGSWVVPRNVTSVTVNVLGARGGDFNSSGFYGLGGSSTGTIAVSPGETLYYCVGGEGESVGLATTTQSGGACGGGDAPGAAVRSGSAGGGYTGVFSSSTLATSTAYLIAGGGGGVGANNGGTSGVGGDGGGTTGEAGTAGTQGAGGGGGTPTAGGAAGGGTATAGSALQGGDAGNGANQGGGAGGGGYFGGGGGQEGSTGAGGGGGGSNFVHDSLTSTSTTRGVNDASGQVTFSFSAYSPDTDTYGLAVGGHILYGGPVPTVNSGSIDGHDGLGTITTGSSTTSWVLTFGESWLTAPVCFAQIASGTPVAFSSNTRTTSTTFTAASAVATSSRIGYFCGGH